MIDVHLLRKEREATEKRLKRKLPQLSCDELMNVDKQLRELQQQVEFFRSERKSLSDQIGTAKKEKKDATALSEKVAACNQQLDELEIQLRGIQEHHHYLLSLLPNLPLDTIPDGDRPENNIVLHSRGPFPAFTFPPKNHMELNERLALFDLVRATKVAGSGWTAYRGMGARLEWALIQFMLQHHIKKGFEMWLPPLVVRPEISFGAGQLPKFADQQFQTLNGETTCYLIPTAEVPLTGLHADEVLTAEQLPLRYVAYSPCFRKEAGAAGSNERGLIRTHQFNKVEMYALCAPEASELLFQDLGLHYRSVLLAAGDISFAAAKTVDVEVYLPGQGRYYEVSSVSNCTDFQARRTPLRFRRDPQAKPEFLHTLNGSGVATSRLMVALLENNQQADGSVTIPEPLRPYLDGKTHLLPIASTAQ